ncbi:MAG: class II aldolase/adducin family protein [Escherichia sp.]
MAIKPSGVAYEAMKADDMVVVDLEGRVVDGRYHPLPIPPRIWRCIAATRVWGVVHTHSTHATAQA